MSINWLLLSCILGLIAGVFFAEKIDERMTKSVFKEKILNSIHLLNMFFSIVFNFALFSLFFQQVVSWFSE